MAGSGDAQLRQIIATEMPVEDESDALKDPNAVDRDPRPGEHVTARMREKVDGKYLWHHGIFIGEVDGELRVVEMGGLGVSPPIQLGLWRDFIRNTTYAVITYPTDELNSGRALRKSVQRANKLLAEAAAKPSKYTYDVVTNNCETLAMFCRTGMWLVSKQVLSVLVEKLAQYINRFMHGLKAKKT